MNEAWRGAAAAAINQQSWWMLACCPGGGNPNNQQINHSNQSIKSIKLIDEIDGDWLLMLVAPPHSPIKIKQSLPSFSNNQWNWIVLLNWRKSCWFRWRWLLPLLCWIPFHSIHTPQRGPQSKEKIIDWFRPFSKSGNQINLSFSLRGLSTFTYQ